MAIERCCAKIHRPAARQDRRLLDDFAAYMGLGFIGGVIFMACFHPVHTAMIVRWVLSW